MKPCSRPKSRRTSLAPSLKSSGSERARKCKNEKCLTSKPTDELNFLGSKKEDWNEKVRKSTIHRNPIGSTSEALQRQRSRQSLRRHIMEDAGLTMNTESLLEFNPKLADVSHSTRVAYAKFMTTKLKKEIKFEDDKVVIENEKERARGTKAFNRFKANAGILKKTVEETKEPEPEAPPPSPAPEEMPKDFRARTPIEEDPNEDSQTPDRPSTPENILDEPVPQISSNTIATPSPVPKSSSASPSPSPTPTPTPESRKADSPIVKPRSMSVTSVTSAKSPEPPTIKAPELSKTDEEDEDEKPEPTRKSSVASPTNLQVPQTAARPSSPTISIGTGDKGKSKITGKTLTGWI